MAFTDSKPHYALLDGLRGVAALLVVPRIRRLPICWQQARHRLHQPRILSRRLLLHALRVCHRLRLRRPLGQIPHDKQILPPSSHPPSSHGHDGRTHRSHLLPAYRHGTLGQQPLHAAPHPHSPHLFMAHDSRTTRNAPRSTRQRRDVSPQRSLLVPLL